MTTDRPVTAADVSCWADVADDHNPLHLDPGFAAGTRFGRPIVHGSLLFALVCDEVQADRGRAWEVGGGLAVRFRAPVPVGEQVRVEVERGTARLLCAGAEPVDIRLDDGEAP